MRILEIIVNHVIHCLPSVQLDRFVDVLVAKYSIFASACRRPYLSTE